MSQLQRQMMLIGILAIFLAGINIWCYNQMASARKRADAAAHDAAEIAQLADQIELLRQQPTFTNEELPELKINQLIYDAAQAEGLDPDNKIVSIVPQKARRITGTAYKQKDTHLKLDNVKLVELLHFLHQLVHDNPGLKVESLQLTTPSADVGDNWDVEPLVISYLIYSP